MKRFQYRLERLLSVRQREEREHAREVADLLAVEAMHRRRLEESERRRTVAERQIAELRGAIGSAGIQLAADNLFRAIRQDVRRERDAQHEAAGRAERAREAFVLARQRTRVLERLRERRKKDWQTGVERTERRADDEVAANVRLRRAR